MIQVRVGNQSFTSTSTSTSTAHSLTLPHFPLPEVLFLLPLGARPVDVRNPRMSGPAAYIASSSLHAIRFERGCFFFHKSDHLHVKKKEKKNLCLKQPKQ